MAYSHVQTRIFHRRMVRRSDHTLDLSVQEVSEVSEVSAVTQLVRKLAVRMVEIDKSYLRGAAAYDALWDAIVAECNEVLPGVLGCEIEAEQPQGRGAKTGRRI